MPAATTQMRATACLSFTCLSTGAVFLDHSATPFNLRQYVGAQAYRKDFADLLAGFPGKPQVELIDPFVDARGDLGYSHAVVHSRFPWLSEWTSWR